MHFFVSISNENLIFLVFFYCTKVIIEGQNLHVTFLIISHLLILDIFLSYLCVWAVSYFTKSVAQTTKVLLLLCTNVMMHFTQKENLLGPISETKWETLAGNCSCPTTSFSSDMCSSFTIGERVVSRNKYINTVQILFSIYITLIIKNISWLVLLIIPFIFKTPMP